MEEVEEEEMIGLDLLTGFALASETIEILLENVKADIYDKEIYKRSQKFGIVYILELILSTVECKYIRSDPGTVFDWHEDEEPSSNSIDTWARSVIPVHKKFKSPSITATDNLLQPLDSKSTVSFKTSFYRTNSMRRLKPAQEKPIKEGSLPFPMDFEMPVISDAEEFIRLKKERDFKKKQEEMKRMEALKKEEDVKKKLLSKQLNGKVKDYTYDCNGKLIVVVPFNTDKKVIETMNYKVLSQRLPAAEDLPKRSVIEVPVVEKKTHAFDPSPERNYKFAPSVNILEHLRLAPGVSLISDQSKSTSSPRSLENRNAKKGTDSEPTLKLKKPLKELPQPQSQTIKNMNLLETISENVRHLPQLPPVAKTYQYEKKKQTADLVKQYTRDSSKNLNLNSIDLFNIAILSNPKWGSNPPSKGVELPLRMPKSLTAKDKWQVYGHIIKKPKDTPFASTQDLWSLTDTVKKPRDRPYMERKQKVPMNSMSAASLWNTRDL